MPLEKAAIIDNQVVVSKTNRKHVENMTATDCCLQ